MNVGLLEDAMELGAGQLGELVQSIWLSAAGFASERCEVGEFAGSAERHVAACVQFTGGWEGSLVLECPETLGIEVASSMFAMEPSEIGKGELSDALGEVANMIGGNLKPLLPGACQLSMPTVVEGTEFELLLPGTRQIQRVGLKSQGKGFAVAVYDKQEAQAK